MKTKTNKQRILVADIGGTNTRIAIARGTELIDGSCAKYSNAKFQDLAAVLIQYGNEFDMANLSGACIAVAGPVENGTASLTNLSWTIDLTTLAKATQTENVAILNDLQAQGHGLAYLPENSCPEIVTAPAPTPGTTKLVVGMGTGFNAAVVLESAAGTLVPASECGHINLPINTQEDLNLTRKIRAKSGYCEIDDVLSGRGLEHIYQWHAAKHGSDKSAPAPEIIELLVKGNDAVARATIRHFVQLAGTVIGDLALVHLPFGGIYLAGGVSRAIGPYFKDFEFENAFRSDRKLSVLMAGFTVSIIQDDNAALIGCARYLSAA